jgi:prepilin signal peptidase PulO-like enzyme (type II secretory pathway)
MLSVFAAVKDAKTSTIPNMFPFLICFAWACGCVWRIIATVASGQVWYYAFFINDGIFNSSVLDGFLGALLIFILLMTVTLIYEHLTSKFAMGGGDIKLMSALALYVGVQGIIGLVLGSCVIYIIWSLVKSLLVRVRAQKNRGEGESRAALSEPTPMGPAIVAAFLIYTCLSVATALL